MNNDNNLYISDSTLEMMVRMLPKPILYYEKLKKLKEQNQWVAGTELTEEEKLLMWAAIWVEEINRFQKSLFLELDRQAEAAAEEMRAERENEEKEYKTWGWGQGGSTPENELDEGIKLTLQQMLEQDQHLRERMNNIIINVRALSDVQKQINEWPVQRLQKEAAQYRDQSTRLANHLLDGVKNGEITDPLLKEQIIDYHEQVQLHAERQVNLDATLDKIGAAKGISQENRGVQTKLLGEIVRGRGANLELKSVPPSSTTTDNSEKTIGKLGHIGFAERSKVGKEFASEDERLKVENDAFQKQLDKKQKELVQIISDAKTEFLKDVKAKGVSVSHRELHDFVEANKLLEAPSKDKGIEERYGQTSQPESTSMDEDQESSKKPDTISKESESIESTASTNDDPQKEPPQEDSNSNADSKKDTDPAEDLSSSDAGPSI